jgi:hypothetical protein
LPIPVLYPPPHFPKRLHAVRLFTDTYGHPARTPTQGI